MMKLRRKMLAVLAGLLVFGLVSAAAATLGGLTVRSLGAESEVVASCDNDGIAVDWGITLQGVEYVVDSVELSDVAAACDGLNVEVTIFDGDSPNNVLATVSGVADDSGSLSLALGSPQPASEIHHIAVLIAG